MTDDFETTVVHAGWEPDPITGAVVPPIQMSSTFKQDAVGQTRAGFRSVGAIHARWITDAVSQPARALWAVHTWHSSVDDGPPVRVRPRTGR